MAGPCAICGRVVDTHAIDWATGADDPSSVCPSCIEDGSLDDWEFRRAMIERDLALDKARGEALSSLVVLLADAGWSSAQLHTLIDQAFDVREVDRRR